MQQNATTYCKPVQVFPPASRAGAVTSDPIDCMGFEDGLVEVNVGAITGGGTIDFKVRECDTVDGQYADVPGAAFTQIPDSGGGKLYIGGLLLRNRKRFLELVLTPATQASIVGVTFNRYYGKELPVVQNSAVALEFEV